MAVLFMDGFDADDRAMKWDYNLNTASTNTTRFGTGKALSLAVANNLDLRKIFTASAQIYVGFAFYCGGSVTKTFFNFYGDGGTVKHLYLYAGATPNILELYRGGAVKLATYTEIPYQTWCYMEVSATIDDTVGTCVVKLNGQTIIDYTGDTKNGGVSSNIDAVGFGGESYCGFYPYIDDFYISDSEFMGDIRIQTLVPSAAGSSTQLTPTGGANYANVADIPDSTATYNASSTVGNKDLYALGDLAATTTTVKCVQVNTHSWKDDAGTASLKAKIKSGSTEADGTTTSLPSSVAWVGDRWETDPNTSAAWTVSAVNSLEAGAEVA